MGLIEAIVVDGRIVAIQNDETIVVVKAPNVYIQVVLVSIIDVMAINLISHTHGGLMSKKGRILDDASIVGLRRSRGTMEVPRRVRRGFGRNRPIEGRILHVVYKAEASKRA